MATYSTLFVMTDDELTQFFPGWRMPTPNPEEKEMPNPFMPGQVLKVKIWDPGPKADQDKLSSVQDAYGRSAVASLLSPETDYENHLEDLVPPLLKTFPHIGTKNATIVEFMGLCDALNLPSDPESRFVGTREDEGIINSTIEELLVALAEMDEPMMNAAARKWCESTGEGTEEDFRYILERLCTLARSAAECKGHLLSYCLV